MFEKPIHFIGKRNPLSISQFSFSSLRIFTAYLPARRLVNVNLDVLFSIFPFNIL